MSAIKRTLGFIFSHPLAKKNKLTALSRFISWQIKSRMSSQYFIVPFLSQSKIYAKRGLTGITGSIYTGLHEFEDMAFLLHFLRKEDVFFDVGANVGSYSILAAAECKTRTLAFEPIPHTYSILQKNIALNNISHLLRAENIGVGSVKGSLYFTKEEDTTNHILAKDELRDNALQVPIEQLDSYYPDFIPALVKIDVEGFETEVLNGASKILDNSTLKAIIIELNGSGNRYGYNEEKIHRKLLSLSFRPYNYDPFLRNLMEKTSFGAFNTIYVRDKDLVEKKIKEAPRFKVLNEYV